MTGTVKWFDPQKHFGFITPDDQRGDVFVHASEIQGEAKRLKERDVVEFDIEDDRRGPKAKRVRILTSSSGPAGPPPFPQHRRD